MRLRLPSVPVRWAIGIVMFVLVFAWFTAPNPAPTGDNADPFVDRWLINGTDPFGGEYSGSLRIVADGDRYTLEWLITGAIVSGTGERVLDEVQAEWMRSAGDEVITGTARYRIDAAGTIVGTVRVRGVDGTGTETGERAGG